MMTTFTNKIINPLDMHDKDIDILDIAHALALCNRFAGHTKMPVSVAQHSVFVSRLCPKEDALQGLLHDASEAYLGDVTKWLKRDPAFALYREAEERLQHQIYQHFGCDVVMSKNVESADQLMVRIEASRSFDIYPIRHPDYGEPSRYEEILVGDWEPWGWKLSERTFIQLFRNLQEALLKDFTIQQPEFGV